MTKRVYTVKNKAGSRFLNSAKGIFTALGLIVFFSGWLVKNEIRSVKNIRAFEEVRKNYTPVINAQRLSENEGRLVAVEGGEITFTPVADDFFGVAANTFHLRRDVEFFQRTETRHGSSTDAEVTYTYDNAWSATRINSQGFQDPSERNANAAVPVGVAYSAKSFLSSDAKVGDFSLSQSQLQQLRASVMINPSEVIADNFVVGGSYVFNAGYNPSAPKIGDVRISFFICDVTRASVMAQQSGTNLLGYIAKNGVEINRVYPGNRSGAQMVEMMKSENETETWAYRLVLTIFICLCFGALFTPVQVLVSMIPFVGKFLGKATGKVAQVIGVIVGVALSLLIISLSWIAVRPLVAIPLLVVVVGLIVIARLRGKNKGQSEPSATDANSALSALANIASASANTGLVGKWGTGNEPAVEIRSNTMLASGNEFTIIISGNTLHITGFQGQSADLGSVNFSFNVEGNAVTWNGGRAALEGWSGQTWYRMG